MYQAVFVEAGHGKSYLGPKDPGAVARFGLRVFKERAVVLEIARRVKLILTAKLPGILVQGVGIESDATPLKKMQFVNTVIRENRFSPGNCVGLAIHLNSSISGKPRGFECWYQKKMIGAERLGNAVLTEWENYNILPLRARPLNNTKDHSLYHRLYIDDALCPYLLVEVGFISNFEDLDIILKNLDRVAECFAHSLLEFDKK
jgi:N-acetylmuramoyl-L-alanine amidase